MPVNRAFSVLQLNIQCLRHGVLELLNDGLLGCYTCSYNGFFPTFRRNMLSPPSGCLNLILLPVSLDSPVGTRYVTLEYRRSIETQHTPATAASPISLSRDCSGD